MAAEAHPSEAARFATATTFAERDKLKFGVFARQLVQLSARTATALDLA